MGTSEFRDMRQTSCKGFRGFSALLPTKTSALALLFALLLAQATAPADALAQTGNTHAGTASLKVPVILVVGDSLSSAFGMAQNKGWVNLLQNRLRDQKYPHRVINASITGETTQGGASRISGLLDQHQPDIVLVELGGNDGLRGLPIALMKKGLDEIIRSVQARQIRVLLIGMQLPPNYGIRYTRQFIETYTGLAAQHKTALVPFLMQGFATNPDLIQADGIHPREEAQTLMLDNVWPALVDMLGNPRQKN